MEQSFCYKVSKRLLEKVTTYLAAPGYQAFTDHLKESTRMSLGIYCDIKSLAR